MKRKPNPTKAGPRRPRCHNQNRARSYIPAADFCATRSESESCSRGSLRPERAQERGSPSNKGTKIGERLAFLQFWTSDSLGVRPIKDTGGRIAARAAGGAPASSSAPRTSTAAGGRFVASRKSPARGTKRPRARYGLSGRRATKGRPARCAICLVALTARLGKVAARHPAATCAAAVRLRSRRHRELNVRGLLDLVRRRCAVGRAYI